MHDDHPHPLLAQVPLTVSPFLSLPTSIPLPYSYQSLPSTLPTSILAPPQSQSQSQAHPSISTPTPDPTQNRPHQQQHQHQQDDTSSPQNQSAAYITSQTGGTSATPDQILQSCVALRQHIFELEEQGRAVLREWQERKEKEMLDEKRRVAPGWLDSGVHLLRPDNVGDGLSGVSSAGSGGGGATSLGNSGLGSDGHGLVGGRGQGDNGMEGVVGTEDTSEGKELDRLFGGLNVTSS